MKESGDIHHFRLAATLGAGLFFSACLWLGEALHFFIRKIFNPGIWFFLPWRALLLYLATGASISILVYGAVRLFPGRKKIRTGSFQSSAFAVLAVLLTLYSIAFFEIRLCPLVERWLHRAGSLAALVAVATAVFLASRFLGHILTAKLSRTWRRSLGGAIAAFGIVFCLFHTFINVNDFIIPQTRSPGMATGPNLVVILVDTLRSDSLGCYGNQGAQTPHIDNLAKDGILFRQCISQAPWTFPSVGSLFTSRYPSQHGAESQRVFLGEHKVEKTIKSGWLREDNTTLFEILKRNGYATAVFQPNITVGSFLGFNQGVDFFFDLFKNEQMIFEEAVAPLSKERVNTLLYPRFLYAGDEADIRYAREWLAKNARTKFCLFLMLFDNHEYYLDIVGYGRRFDLNKETSADALRRKYREYVERTDRTIGEFLDGLRKLQRFDDTVIVLLSDHGEEIFDHGGEKGRSGSPYDTGLYHGHTLYDEILRVPLILKLPLGLSHPQEVEGQVRTIDILPTVLSLLHIKTGVSLEGRDLAQDNFAGNDGIPAFSESVLEYPEVKSIRKDGWKLIYHEESGACELYDLRHDPKEKVNLGGKGAELESQLRQELLDWTDKIEEEQQKNPDAKKQRELTRKEIEALKSLGYIRSP
jgi:arylsulfatase A-like enzyme